MFHMASPVGPEKVETQTVFPWIDLTFQLSAKCCPLCRINNAFENRPLYALPVVLTESRYSAQPSLARF